MNANCDKVLSKQRTAQIQKNKALWQPNWPRSHGHGRRQRPDAPEANAGGVTASYFWSEVEINDRLVVIMQEAFAGIWDVAQHHQVSLRTATFIVACTRILRARNARFVPIKRFFTTG